MDRRTSLSYLVGIATLAAVIFFILTMRALFGSAEAMRGDVGFTPPVTVEAATTSRINVPQRGYAPPARLLIPAISVNAKVQHVGLTKSGAMGIPSNFVDVAWYKYGTIPGEDGSAVIAGHVDNALGLSGVFKRLKDLKQGDIVTVVDKEGKKVTFTITSVVRYKYNEAPTEEIFNSKGKTYLRLITCGGKWLRSEKTYDERIVVTAEAQL